MSLEVIEPGLLTTVQDMGRADSSSIGVPTGGAGDRWSLAVANLLVGNAPGAAALEMTLVGPTLRATAAIRIGLAGAELGGHERETGRALRPGQVHHMAAGTTIAFPGVANRAAGARAYLALPGGIDVPEILGSRSTALAAGFGGLDGRPLRAGDVVMAGPVSTARTDPRHTERGSELGSVHSRSGGDAWPESIGPIGATGPKPDTAIRVVAGPWPGVADLVGHIWRVGPGSDRVGLRLEGPPVRLAEHAALPSFGVIPGAIQVPPDGAPIILLADAQTTGGYPVVAVAIAADLPRLGQLRPGSEVRFEAVTIEAATEAIRAQHADLERGLALLRESRAWDDAWHSAGG